MRRRNSTGQFTSNESSISRIEHDQDIKKELSSYLKILFTIMKVVLVIILLFPFIDKLRQSEMMAKLFEYLSHIDIGCKPCNISLIHSNITSGDRTKTYNGL
jgi:uncharacterized membrane protein YwzB